MPVETRGWRPGKFVVSHYTRGDLLDGEAFVLVPERDPAAVHAVLAYAAATPDPELALKLREWVGSISDRCGDPVPPVIDKLPSWVASLGHLVESGETKIEAALWTLAKWTLAETETKAENNASQGGDNE